MKADDKADGGDIQRLLKRLHADADAAAECYLSLRRRTAKYFSWKGCYPAEDLAAEALERVARRLKDVEVEDIAKYTLEVARLMCLEFYRGTKRDLPIDVVEPIMPGDRQPEVEIIERLDQETQLKYLRMCLETLAEEDRDLILGFYGAGSEDAKNKDQRRTLAENLRMTPINLRVRASRIRERLEQCITRRRSSDKGRAASGTAQ